MKVAFTGSARTLTHRQKITITARIENLPKDTLIVTGACIGVDAFVARVAFKLGLVVHTVVPANRSKVDPDWRLFATTFEEMPEGSSYRDRNTRMVELAKDLLIGYPETETNGRDIGSGSWMTIRIAQRRGRHIEVLPLDRIK